jgi:hypothetical protein
MIFVFMMVWTEDPPPLVSETDLSSAYSSKRYRGDERNWTDYTLEKNNLKVRIVQNSPEMQGRSAISISYRYAEFKDPAGREGVSNIVNNALFTTGNRASSLWSTLVTEYNIYYKRVDKYEDSYYGAEFDSRGFEEVLTHLAAGLIDPQCTEANGFDISAVGDDEFNKYDASPLERGVLAEISYSDPKSKWGRINNLNTTKLFPGVSKAEWEKTVAGWVC